MPRLAPSICPRCNHRKPHGTRCACMPAPKRIDMRPSARQRGYDTEYERAARAFLAEPGNERCACGAPAVLVRHVISIRKRPDLRMVRSNWRPGCASCNAKDAHRDKVLSEMPDKSKAKAQSEMSVNDRGAGRGSDDFLRTARPPTAQNSAENSGGADRC